MIHLKTEPKGIDAVIQPLQEALYGLCESWGDIRAFGRCYLNERQDRKIPEHYAGSGEYQEVLTDDKWVATYFFLESDTIIHKGSCLSENNVDLYFLVNAKEAKPKITHYADEEIRLEVLQIANLHFSSIDSTVKGREALSEITATDLDFIHPYFIFKITGTFNNY